MPCRQASQEGASQLLQGRQLSQELTFICSCSLSFVFTGVFDLIASTAWPEAVSTPCAADDGSEPGMMQRLVREN